MPEGWRVFAPRGNEAEGNHKFYVCQVCLRDDEPLGEYDFSNAAIGKYVKKTE